MLDELKTSVLKTHLDQAAKLATELGRSTKALTFTLIRLNVQRSLRILAERAAQETPTPHSAPRTPNSSGLPAIPVPRSNDGGDQSWS